MIPGIDPKVDYAFKKVFGSESNVPLLLDLLNAVLRPTPDRRIMALEILNPFNDKDGADDKLSILDIKARDSLGRQYNIEMEMTGLIAYPERALYYWAVLHGRQLQAGQDYAKLRPTISISFVNRVLFPQVPEHHLEFRLANREHPDLLFSRQLEIHLLELPKFRRAAAELVDPLDAWCYFLVHGAELDTDQLPAALDTPPIQKAMEVLTVLTQDEIERERYESRIKFERDQRSLQRESTEQGIEQGREQGRKEVLVDHIRFCQRLLKQQQTPGDELLALALADLETKARALEKQLGAAESP